MKKVIMIRFAMPVARILKHSSDLSFYRVDDKDKAYLNIWYDGVDFIIENTLKEDGRSTSRKVYVAKTNVSQWELDDTERAQDSQGIPEEVCTETKPKTSRVSRAK